MDEPKFTGRLASIQNRPSRPPEQPAVKADGSRGNTHRNLPGRAPNVRKLLGFRLTKAEESALAQMDAEEQRLQEQILEATHDAVRRRFKDLHAAAITDSDAAGDLEQSKQQAFLEARERRGRLKARLRVVRAEACPRLAPIVARLQTALEAKRQAIEDTERELCDAAEIAFEPSLILRSLENSRTGLQDLARSIERGKLLCPARSVFQPYLVK